MRHMGWIPIQPTPLVGRSQEVETILRMLTVEGVRLLTLVGPAGVGKTRLALAAAADAQLADRFPDGVTLVDLAPVRAPQECLGAIGRALALWTRASVRWASAWPRYLQERATAAGAGQLRAGAAGRRVAGRPAGGLSEAGAAGDQPGAAPTTLGADAARRAAARFPISPRRCRPWMSWSAIPSVALFVQRARARARRLRPERAAAPLRGPTGRAAGRAAAGARAGRCAAGRALAVHADATAGRPAATAALEAPDLPERQRSLEAAVGLEL